MTAPDSRSLRATNESRTGFDPTNASDPAVVCIRSAVSMLSLIGTGTPCSGPRILPALRSRSRLAAIDQASGFSSITLFTPGPDLSTASIRETYFSTSDCAVNFPEAIPDCSSVVVISSSSKSGTESDLPLAGADRTPAAIPPKAVVFKNCRRLPPALFISDIRLALLQERDIIHNHHQRDVIPPGFQTPAMTRDVRHEKSAFALRLQISFRRSPTQACIGLEWVTPAIRP